MEPQLHSIHLETTFRRDAFRRARDVLSAALGEKTLTGHSHLDDRDDQETPPGISFPPIASLFWRGKSWELRLGINTIGRLPDNQICLDDPSVSRRHCAIVVHSDDHIEVYDIASKNGTAVNGQTITGSVEIHQGDELLIGERRLMVFLNQKAKQVTPKLSRTEPTSIL